MKQSGYWIAFWIEFHVTPHHRPQQIISFAVIITVMFIFMARSCRTWYHTHILNIFIRGTKNMGSLILNIELFFKIKRNEHKRYKMLQRMCMWLTFLTKFLKIVLSAEDNETIKWFHLSSKRKKYCFSFVLGAI